MSFLIYPTIKQSPIQGLTGLWGGAAGALMGASGYTGPRVFLQQQGDADINTMTDYNGVAGDGVWRSGDLVECIYHDGSTKTWYARGHNGTLKIYFVGAGGASMGDNGGWCSNSGGGGGGGCFGTFNPGGSNINFSVGRGGYRTSGTAHTINRSDYTTGGNTVWHQATVYGGQVGYWCKNPTFRADGGGTNVTGFQADYQSPGGEAGGAEANDGSEPSTNGEGKTYGGGGGGGSDDNNNTTRVQRRGGQCASSMDWTQKFYNTTLSKGVYPANQDKPYGGAGEPNTVVTRSTTVTSTGNNAGYDGAVPTPNRGGGAGGITSYNGGNNAGGGHGGHQQGVNGANGCVIIEIV